MKACPYCAEEIQDAAVLCRWCGRDLPLPALAPGDDLPTPPAAALEQVITQHVAEGWTLHSSLDGLAVVGKTVGGVEQRRILKVADDGSVLYRAPHQTEFMDAAAFEAALRQPTFTGFSTPVVLQKWGKPLALVGGAVFLIALVAAGTQQRKAEPGFYDRFPKADSAPADLAALDAKADALMAQVQQAGVRVNCARREADVPALVWAQFSTTEKRGFVITAARSCRVPRFTLRDAATARTIARLSAGEVTFE